MQAPLPGDGNPGVPPGTTTPTGDHTVAAGTVNALEVAAPPVVNDPLSFISDVVKALETPGTTVETFSTYVGEGVALAGFVVGAFDHQLGLAISAVPQATILAASTAIAGGLAIYRLFAKTQKQKAAAALVGQMHADHMAARFAA